MNTFYMTMLKAYPEVAFIPEPCAKKACGRTDIITTSTPARKAVLRKSWIHTGTHFNGIGVESEV